MTACVLMAIGAFFGLGAGAAHVGPGRTGDEPLID
jgi:hypothetical protein